jgi:histidyl-tRNA synthetase
MAVEQGSMSGFRDMLPEQMIPRNAMLDTIGEVYESYGFTPIMTPALERLSTLTGKYGEEGEKLMYKFADNGGRMVALRYDMTVPLARVVAQYSSNLPSPFKRYVVGPVWRGERAQKARYREFLQFDADIVGTASPVADAEIVAMMSDTMGALGADSLVRVNNRRILDGLAEKAGAQTESDSLQLITTIDKVDKIGKAEVLKQINDGFSAEAAMLVDDYLSVTGAPLDRLRQMPGILGDSGAVREGVDNLTQVFNMLEASGYSLDKIVFDQTIARGLDYYTGIIYETTLVGAEEMGSVCSGGRYDNLVKAMGGPDRPAVGTSIGVDRLFDGLQKLGLLKAAHTKTEVLVTNFDAEHTPDYMRVATALRQLGVPAEVSYDPVKIDKQFRRANNLGIPYVVVMGPQELGRGVGIVKTMASGEQTEVPLDSLAETIINLRSQK